jgi:transposase-like protein
MAEDDPESPQRWTAKRRATLILSILKGETSAQAAARKHGLTVAEVEEWRDRFLLGAENALRARPKDEDALKDEQIKKLKQKVGELVLDLDILKEASKDRPFAPKTSDESGAARGVGASGLSGSRRGPEWDAARDQRRRPAHGAHERGPRGADRH